MWPTFKFWDTLYISSMDKDADFKFGVLIDSDIQFYSISRNLCLLVTSLRSSDIATWRTQFHTVPLGYGTCLVDLQFTENKAAMSRPEYHKLPRGQDITSLYCLHTCCLHLLQPAHVDLMSERRSAPRLVIISGEAKEAYVLADSLQLSVNCDIMGIPPCSTA